MEEKYCNKSYNTSLIQSFHFRDKNHCNRKENNNEDQSEHSDYQLLRRTSDNTAYNKCQYKNCKNNYSRTYHFIGIISFFNKSFVLKGHIMSKVTHSPFYFTVITTIQHYCRGLTKRSFISPISSFANFGLVPLAW